MNLQELDFFCSIYGKKHLPFVYFKDKYALDLLTYFIKDKEMAITEIKKSRWGFLLNKKVPKSIIAQLGHNKLKSTDLQTHWKEENIPFSISLSDWGFSISKHRKNYRYQTTRPAFNIVIQLNFTQAHDVPYYKQIRPRNKQHPFRFLSHPVAKNNTLTMAWARLDFDLETGEVLIEEIQNDWLREVKDLEKYLKKESKNNIVMDRHWFFRETNSNLSLLSKYVENTLAPYPKIWEEAMLSAAIWFAKAELGLHDIYYHTYETGKVLKRCAPPRSIYTKLPKRFGFQKTNKAPRFIQNCHYLKKKLRTLDLDWWKL